jgi:CheY-like chemotaxis protein
MTVPNTKAALIVLACDQMSACVEAAEILTDDGYRVVAAASGEQAVAVIHARWETRVAVTDANLSGHMDGYALARVLDIKWPGIGVIVVGTRHPRPEDLPSNARFLHKPYARASLISVVHELLDEGPACEAAPPAGRHARSGALRDCAEPSARGGRAYRVAVEPIEFGLTGPALAL